MDITYLIVDTLLTRKPPNGYLLKGPCTSILNTIIAQEAKNYKKSNFEDDLASCFPILIYFLHLGFSLFLTFVSFSYLDYIRPSFVQYQKQETSFV